MYISQQSPGFETSTDLAQVLQKAISILTENLSKSPEISSYSLGLVKRLISLDDGRSSKNTKNCDQELSKNGEVLIAENWYRVRSIRNNVFQELNLFGEPAWDILLDLYISRVARKRIPVSSACVASRVPTTTALRWISVLESMELVVRTEDDDDRRRSFVDLTNKGAAMMEAVIQRASLAGAL